LIKLKGADGKCLVAASQNRGKLKIYRDNNPQQKIISLKPGDKTILITLTDGQIRKEEVDHGSSFLSQSSQFITVNASAKKIEIINTKGEKRVAQ